MIVYRWSALALVLALVSSYSDAQTPASAGRMAADAHPSFAVAAIKPHNPDSHEDGMGIHAGGANIRNQTLARLIFFTYAIHPHQIVGAPQWIEELHYDI